MTNEERDALVEEVRASADKIEQGRDHLGVAKVYRFLLGELDEARAALRTWETWDAEHHGGVRAYVAALEADQRRLVVAEQDAAQARADLAEARAQLAALHAAARGYREQRLAWMAADGRPRDGQSNALRAAAEAIDDALAGPASAAAAEHERRVRADERAKSLREAAGRLRLTPGIRSGVDAEARLRAVADEAERGTR